MAPAYPSSSPSPAQASASSFPQSSTVHNGNGYDRTLENQNYQAAAQFLFEVRQLELQVTDLKLEVEKKDGTIDVLTARCESEKKAHSRTRGQVQSLEEKVAAANKTIEAKDEEIKKTQTQADNWKRKYTGEKDSVARAQSQILVLRNQIASYQATIEEMQEARAQMEERYAAAEDNIRDLRAEKANLEQLLTETKTRLRKVEGFATGFSELDEDQMIDGYVSLWEYARTEIYSQIEADLDNKVLQDRSAWAGLRNCSLTIQQRVPVPSSNSLAAKQMRLVIILAILAREIDRYIFQPTYIAGEDCPSRSLLANLAAANSEKEAFCRSILLSLDPEAQSKSCQWRIRTVVQHVSSYISTLLSEEQTARFCESVEKVAQKAVEVWHPIQHASRKYESDFEPADSDDESIPFVFPGQEPAETPSNVNPHRQHSLIIFPRIYAIEENKKILFTPTWLLSNTDPQWVAAQLELDQVPPQSTLERVMSTRLRKLGGRKSSKSH